MCVSTYFHQRQSFVILSLSSFCPKNPVKCLFLEWFFFLVESWTAPEDGYACGSWKEFGVIAYLTDFMEHKTEQWCGEQLWSLFQKGRVFCWGTAPKEMHRYIQIHKMPPKLSPQQPPWAQSCKELVKHPESSPCFSLMLKWNWCCPKANPINKGFLNHISMGWLGLWPELVCVSWLWLSVQR